MNGAIVTEWVVTSRQRICNALAVKHKCSTLLPINEAHNYKREDNRSHRYTQILYEITLYYFLSRIFLPYWLKHWRRFSWCHTDALLFHPVHFAGFPSTETISFTASSICYDEKLNCCFFASSTTMLLHCLLWSNKACHMVRDKNFESLSEFGGVQELALILETDVGINGCEADLLFIDIMFLV